MFNHNLEEIIKKRIREITFIRYQKRVIKSNTATSKICPMCGSLELITVTTAARLTGLNRSTLYNWIANQEVHCVRFANDKLLICCQSLS